MQLKDNIEFHNVAELATYPAQAGVALHRFSREALAATSALGHHVSACSDGVELRFVTGTDWISLTLSARSNYTWATAAQVEVYRGDILIGNFTIADGATQTIKIALPPMFAEMKREALAGGFAPELWRVRFGGMTVFYHHLDCAGQPCRPPRADEKPKLRMLSYGSSITNPMQGYAATAARLLGVDFFNKGMSGSCACEAEVANYLATAEPWDFTTLELGVNIRSVGNEVFEKRCRNLIATLRAAAPKKPLVLITMFPNYDDIRTTPNAMSQVNVDFREILRKIQRTNNDPNLHLIEGDRVLDQIACLSGDLIHPTANGHQQMGMNLAKLLEPIIKPLSV